MYKQQQEPQYYMLVTSLPSFKRGMADHKELPITKIHLERRLRFLADADQKIIDQIADLITADGFATDDAYIEKYKACIKSVGKSSLRPILDMFMDWRVITSSLRASIKGHDAPEWSYGNTKLIETIQQNWKKTDFDLRMSHPQIVLLREYMEGNNTIAVENMLLNIFWEFLAETAFDAQFGLDAVLVYTLRYYILKRWLRRDYDEALKTVNETIENILDKTELSL